jgi:hypothetical protein
MKRALLPFALLFLVLSLLSLGGCASKPPAPTPASPLQATEPSPKDAAAKDAAPSAPVPVPASTVAAPAVPSSEQVAAPIAQKEIPEISFPYRRALKIDFLIASLHEPLLPKKAESAAVAPKPTVDVSIKDAVAKTEPATTPKADAAAKAADAKTDAPKSAAKKPEVKKPEAAKPAAKDAAKDTAKDKVQDKEPDAKNAPSTAALSVATVPEPEVKPDIARNFSAVEGVRFEIPFEGTGWTYLGEKTQREGIAYDSRRFEGTSLVFILNPTKVGDYILRFQRQDSLRGLSYEELVGVTVAPKSSANVEATASTVANPATTPATPATTVANPASTRATAAATSANPATTPATLTATPANQASTPATASTTSTNLAVNLATPEAALAQARSELAAGRPQGALEALDRLLALAPAGTDEAYMLYARALEANGPQKDIQRAYSYYKKVRDEYPESAFWDEAAARAAYIERHYFDIR